jgi:hypothetical protein
MQKTQEQKITNPPAPTVPSEEEQKKAFEMKAEVKIYNLFQAAKIINLASTRGAFRGDELSHVGSIFDSFTSGVDKALKIAKEEIEKEKSSQPTTSLETITE